MVVLAILWLAIPNTANGQILENRGKLKTMKSEGRGFLHFLKRGKIKSAEPSGTFSGKKGRVKYSPAPKAVKKSIPQYSQPSGVLDFSNEVPSPRYSRTNSKQFKGKKNKVRSKSGSNSQSNGILNFSNDRTSPRYSPPDDKQFKGKKNNVRSISGSMNWFGSDGRKSYFNPSISGFQGQQRRPNQKGSKLYFKDVSRIQSKVVVQSAPIKRQWLEAGFQGLDKGKSKRGSKLYFRDVSRDQSKEVVQVSPIKRRWPEAGYQGFDKGKNRRGSKLYFRDVSREQSKVIVSSIPFENATRNSHRFKGFEKGPNKKGSKLYFKELSREQSKVLISTIPFENATRNSHKYKGFEKGKSRLGNKLYYRDVSRDLSGVVISYNKPAVFTDTHKFKGLSRDRSRWGEWWFQWETSRAQARFEGVQQTISYADKMKYADKMAGKMAGYTGGFKTPKRNNQMHPSASYVYGKRASSPSQKELFRKLNVLWVRVNGNKAQPDSVRDKPEKLKFDKKEKDLWNY
jgi:hypothetical protein